MSKTMRTFVFLWLLRLFPKDGYINNTYRLKEDDMQIIIMMLYFYWYYFIILQFYKRQDNYKSVPNFKQYG